MYSIIFLGILGIIVPNYINSVPLTNRNFEIYNDRVIGNGWNISPNYISGPNGFQWQPNVKRPAPPLLSDDVNELVWCPTCFLSNIYGNPQWHYEDDLSPIYSSDGGYNPNGFVGNIQNQYSPFPQNPSFNLENRFNQRNNLITEPLYKDLLTIPNESPTPSFEFPSRPNLFSSNLSPKSFPSPSPLDILNPQQASFPNTPDDFSSFNVNPSISPLKSFPTQPFGLSNLNDVSPDSSFKSLPFSFPPPNPLMNPMFLSRMQFLPNSFSNFPFPPFPFKMFPFPPLPPPFSLFRPDPVGLTKDIVDPSLAGFDESPIPRLIEDMERVKSIIRSVNRLVIRFVKILSENTTKEKLNIEIQGGKPNVLNPNKNSGEGIVKPSVNPIQVPTEPIDKSTTTTEKLLPEDSATPNNNIEVPTPIEETPFVDNSVKPLTETPVDSLVENPTAPIDNTPIEPTVKTPIVTTVEEPKETLGEPQNIKPEVNPILSEENIQPAESVPQEKNEIQARSEEIPMNNKENEKIPIEEDNGKKSSVPVMANKGSIEFEGDSKQVITSDGTLVKFLMRNGTVVQSREKDGVKLFKKDNVIVRKVANNIEQKIPKRKAVKAPTSCENTKGNFQDSIDFVKGVHIVHDDDVTLLSDVTPTNVHIKMIDKNSGDLYEEIYTLGENGRLILQKLNGQTQCKD